MKRFRGFAALLALALTAVVIAPAFAANSYWTEKPLKLVKATGSAAVDTLTLGTVNDTCRTEDIDLSTMDTSIPLNGVDSLGTIGYIRFIVTAKGGNSFGSADSIYYGIEKRAGGVYSGNLIVPTASTGTVACAAGQATLAGEQVFIGLLNLRSAGAFARPGANDIAGASAFRLRICRHSNSPAIQIKANLVYLKRAESF